MAKRQKIVSSSTKTNTCIFQSLYFSNHYDAAILFAKNCNHDLDNSQIFEKSETPDKTLLEHWANIMEDSAMHIEQFNGTVKSLFNILLKTHADGAENVPDLFLIADTASQYIHRTTFECLLTTPHLFNRSTAVRRVQNWQPTQPENLLFIILILENIATDDEIYKFLNSSQGQTRFWKKSISFLQTPLFGKLLSLIPLIEIDFFVDSAWITMENLLTREDVSFQSLAKIGRDSMEQYRNNRVTIVLEYLQFLSRDVCFIINDFNKRYQ